MILQSFEKLCSSLAPLYPWEVASDGDIDHAMGFLDGSTGSHEVARGANGVITLGCFLAVVGVALAPPALRLVAGGVLLALAVGVSALFRRVPELLAAAKRTQALGDAPDLAARCVLWMRIEPTAEGAAAFAARSGDGPLASSLGDHVRRAVGSPMSGLTTFAAEWESWNPALHRSMVLIAAASEAPTGERTRTLDRALTAILDGTRERMAEFVAEIRGPATALYAFGVLLPLALVAVLPAAKTAGLPMSPALLVVEYDVLLPALLLGASVWLLTRRPVAFPPPDVSRSNPDVPDERWPIVALGLGAAGVALAVTTLLLPNWTRWVACVGCFAGTLSVGLTRPTVRVRNRVRAVEACLTDALYLVGRRVNEGQAVEAALVAAGDELSGEMGTVFDRATRVQRQLGMGVKESFLGEYGALSTVPSPRARSAVALLALAAHEGRPAGGAVVAMADHLDDLQSVEREARRELAQVTETLRHTAAIFGPLVSGATVALAGGMASVGSSFGGGPFPVGILGLAVGVYVLLSCGHHHDTLGRTRTRSGPNAGRLSRRPVAAFRDRHLSPCVRVRRGVDVDLSTKTGRLRPMFDAPLDAWYVWLGVAAVSLAVFGVAIELPTSPPPNAASAADTVDSVAGCPYIATAEHPLKAGQIKLGPRQLDLRDNGGTAHATFRYGPIVPVSVVAAGRNPNGKLARVLAGTPPSTVFDSPGAFQRSIRDARNRQPTWEQAKSRLRVRCVSWEGVDATLVSG